MSDTRAVAEVIVLAILFSTFWVTTVLVVIHGKLSRIAEALEKFNE